MYRSIVAMVLGLVWSCATHAASDCADAPNTSDSALLPRYEGACLLASRTTAFEQFRLPLGKPVKVGEKWTTEPVEMIEGEVTRLMYAAPQGRSAVEVLRNYEIGLAQRDYEVMFSCSAAACGGNAQLLNNIVFERSTRRSLGDDTIYYAFQGADQQHFLAARKKDGSVYVSVYVGNSNFKSAATSALMGRAIVLADVIVPAPLEIRLVDAAEMARRINATGRVALDNVYFEFGRSVLTAEAAPALDEMTKLLVSEPRLNVYIVGHTDNVGAFEANLALSRARAQAVVAALVSRGVPESRLSAAGVASLAPLASNRSEAGRTENRWVELVER